MSRTKVLIAVAVVVAGGYVATAQGTVSDIFDSFKADTSDTQPLLFPVPGFLPAPAQRVSLMIAAPDKGPFGSPEALASTAGNSTVFDAAGLGLTLSGASRDLHSEESLAASFIDNQAANAWSADGRYLDIESVLDTSLSSSLFNSRDSGSSVGISPLFLANLDFGQQGSFVQWGLVTSAVPEPSTSCLLIGGALVLGMRFLRRRAIP